MPKWTKLPDKYATIETDIANVSKTATATKDATAIAAAKAANQKFINSYKKEYDKGKNDAAKKAADNLVGKSLMELYNKAIDAVDDAAEDTGTTKPKYTVDGGMPATTLTNKDASYKKAELIVNAMKAGKNPKEAATAGGLSEDPSIIVTDKEKRWAYEFRLSHGGTQHRLNAVATSTDKGKNIKVKFGFLGAGH